MLTCEPGTPLDRDVKTGRIHPAAEGTVLDLFDTTIDFLTAHGFLHYEISNFARMAGPDHKARTSRHNLKYWSFAPYIGLGPCGPLIYRTGALLEPPECGKICAANRNRKISDGGKRKAHQRADDDRSNLPGI